MAKNYHPSASYDFIIDKIINSGKVIKNSLDIVGSSTMIIEKGTSAIFKRTVTIRTIDNEVPFNLATGLAIRFGFMGDLLKWFEEKKGWKEGDYN